MGGVFFYNFLKKVPTYLYEYFYLINNIFEILSYSSSSILNIVVVQTHLSRIAQKSLFVLCRDSILVWDIRKDLTWRSHLCWISRFVQNRINEFGRRQIYQFWWTWPGSNWWPSRCERDALPTELQAQVYLLNNRNYIFSIKFESDNIIYW